jgi:hypothetical protein
MLVAVEQALPRLTRREWGALAVAAAARAGLEEPDLASLRVYLRDQWAIDGAQRASRRAGIPPETGRLRPRSGAA